MKTRLFGTFAGPTLKDAMTTLSGVEGLELRLDAFANVDLQELAAFLKFTPLPILLTLRRKDQGGLFVGSEEERLELLEALCALGPAYVDLEYDVPLAFRKKLFEAYPKIQFLSSIHDFDKTPEDLNAFYRKVKVPYAHIYKFAAMAHSTLDALKVLAFVQTQSQSDKVIGISMGEKGKPSRILAPLVGNYLTFAALSSGHSTAPGQLLAEELTQIYHFSTLSRQNSIYGLIGDPVDKSLGHLAHNAIFADADVPAVYLKMPLNKDELPAFFELASSLPFKGLSVTMPLKEAVLPFLSQPSPEVEKIGACNTLSIDGTSLIGFNTDGIGALNAIEKRGRVKAKHLVFVGAGGAARALLYEAVKRGAHVTILNRTAEKAQTLAAQFGGRGGGWDLFPEVCAQGYDVLINCIPESERIEDAWILPGTIAMDTVYVPKNTPFLVKASAKGCQIVFGCEMFIQQALEQQRIWLADKINLGRASKILETIVAQSL